MEDENGWQEFEDEQTNHHIYGSTCYRPIPSIGGNAAGADDYIIGAIQFQETISQPKVVKLIRSIYPEGLIMVEPLTSIKQIARTIRTIKEYKFYNQEYCCNPLDPSVVHCLELMN
mgnify:CR=1 FL=1